MQTHSGASSGQSGLHLLPASAPGPWEVFKVNQLVKSERLEGVTARCSDTAMHGRVALSVGRQAGWRASAGAGHVWSEHQNPGPCTRQSHPRLEHRRGHTSHKNAALSGSVPCLPRAWPRLGAARGGVAGLFLAQRGLLLVIFLSNLGVLPVHFLALLLAL